MIPAVYIDLSHEFSFAGAWWLPVALKGFARPTVAECALSREKLGHYDILIIHSDTPVKFTPAEVDLIREFVAAGKGLLLTGSGPRTAEEADCPLNQLLAELLPSVQFTPHRAETTGSSLQLCIPEHCDNAIAVLPQLSSCLDDINKDVTASGRRSTTLQLRPAAPHHGVEPVLADAHGAPVVVAGRIGNGRVVISSAPGIVLPRDREHLPAALAALVGWLQPSGQVAEEAATVPDRIYPEHELYHGNLSVYYSEALARYVGIIVNNFNRIYQLVRDQHGDELDSPLKVVLFASQGSGYAATGEIGIGVLGPEATVLAVLAHELTHEWVHPAVLPTSLNEGWASLVASRVLLALGLEKEGQAERELFRQRCKQLEQEQGPLDLRQWPGGPPLGPAYMGKAMALVEAAEECYRQRYGQDRQFTVAFFRKAKAHVREGRYVSMEEMPAVAEVAAELSGMESQQVMDLLVGTKNLTNLLEGD